MIGQPFWLGVIFLKPIRMSVLVNKFSYTLSKVNDNDKLDIIIKRMFDVNMQLFNGVSDKTINTCISLIREQVVNVPPSKRGLLQDMVLVFTVKDLDGDKILVNEEIEFLGIDVNATFRVNIKPINKQIIKLLRSNNKKK